MASCFLLLLLPPQPPPCLPPLLTPTAAPQSWPRLFSSSSLSPPFFQSRLHTLLFPKAIAATRARNATSFPLASHIVAHPPTVHAGRDPRRGSWKAAFSGRPPPRLPQPTRAEAEEKHPPGPPPVVLPPPTLPFGAGDLLRGAWPGFWLQLCIAVLSRALLWAIHRPYTLGFPRPAVAAWVLLGLWRAMSPDAKLGLVPLDRLVAGATGRPDLGPLAYSAWTVVLLSLAVGSFLAMDRLAAWAVVEVARRELTPEAAIAAFSVWSMWVISGAGKGGASTDRSTVDGSSGGRALRWWELAMCGAWVQVFVLCLCLPHNLVKYLLILLDLLRNPR